jgi:hypothetical protein
VKTKTLSQGQRLQRRADGGGYFYVGREVAGLVPAAQRFVLELVPDGVLFRLVDNGATLPRWVKRNG